MKKRMAIERKLLGYQVSQRPQSGYFYTSDLETVANKLRMEAGLPLLTANTYFGLPSTKEFLRTLYYELKQEPTEFIRGKGNGRYVHPYVLIDLALWFSASFKAVSYKWLFDNLSYVKDDSGDSYKTMASAIINNFDILGKLPVLMPKIANKIRFACGLKDVGLDVWEHATKKQFALRDNIHHTAVTLMYVSKTPDVAVDKAIEIVAAQYPELTEPIPMPPLNIKKRIIKKKIVPAVTNI